MKKIILILATTVLVFFALGCKKERWLRVYYDGEFVDSINVTGWEPNEDVVPLSCNFYYPWQGEDSIDCREASDYYKKENYPNVPPPLFLLEVNGKIVGLRTNPFSSIPDSSGIITIVYEPWARGHEDTIHYELSVLERFPNLVGVTIDNIDIGGVNGIFPILDSIPPHLRLYLWCSCWRDEQLEVLSRYPNIRVLVMRGAREGLTPAGLQHLWKLSELRELCVPSWDHTYMFEGENAKRLPKLRKLYFWWPDMSEPMFEPRKFNK